MNEIRLGDQFSYEDVIYKVTHVAPDGRFWAIYIRKADAPYNPDDYITYYGYMQHGDFVTDNAEFERLSTDEIRMVKEAPGMLGLLKEPASK